MANLSREAFARLMAQVEELEEIVEGCETQCKALAAGGHAEQVAAATKALDAAQEELRKCREELARISDGCGHPHHH